MVHLFSLCTVIMGNSLKSVFTMTGNLVTQRIEEEKRINVCVYVFGLFLLYSPNLI